MAQGLLRTQLSRETFCFESVADRVCGRKPNYKMAQLNVCAGLFLKLEEER